MLSGLGACQHCNSQVLKAGGSSSFAVILSGLGAFQHCNSKILKAGGSSSFAVFDFSYFRKWLIMQGRLQVVK
jgi:hypothetical protein